MIIMEKIFLQFSDYIFGGEIRKLLQSDFNVSIILGTIEIWHMGTSSLSH